MPVQTPVVFLIFNRPQHTKRVFAEIRNARPDRLLIVADGARTADEQVRVDETRAIVDNIDWNCRVERRYSDTNLGCRRSVSSGLDWAFSLVDRAIILEDDCLPSQDFFRFCDELLTHFQHDHRIFSISDIV
jgi:GR25 family glycosyltransferase involved in LPS biosynthesis